MSAPAAAGVLGEWRRGWPVAASASLGMGVGIGLFAMTSGLFIQPMQQSFGWSRAEIASASVLTGLLGAFVLPVGGMAVDRFGARRVAAVGLLLYALSLASFAFLTGRLLQYYLLGLVLAVTCIFTGGVVFARPIGMWFVRSRGTALGLTASGVSLIGALTYPLLQQVIARHGWSAGYLTLAALAALAAPLVFLFMRDKPAEPPPASAAGRVADAGPLPEAARTPLVKDGRFWTLAAAVVFANITIGGLVSQLQPMLSDKGVAPATAAIMGSGYAISIALGRVAGGVLLDRLWPPAVAALCMMLPVAGMMGLMVPEPPLLVIAAFVCLLGVGQGAEFDFLAFFIARYFGMKMFGTVMGIMMLFLSLSMSAGTFTFARVFDVTGGYQLALLIGIAANLAGAAALLAGGIIDRRLAVAPASRRPAPAQGAPELAGPGQAGT